MGHSGSASNESSGAPQASPRDTLEQEHSAPSQVHSDDWQVQNAQQQCTASIPKPCQDAHAHAGTIAISDERAVQLCAHPPVWQIDDFITAEEAERVIAKNDATLLQFRHADDVVNQ